MPTFQSVHQGKHYPLHTWVFHPEFGFGLITETEDRADRITIRAKVTFMSDNFIFNDIKQFYLPGTHKKRPIEALEPPSVSIVEHVEVWLTHYQLAMQQVESDILPKWQQLTHIMIAHPIPFGNPTINALLNSVHDDLTDLIAMIDTPAWRFIHRKFITPAIRRNRIPKDQPVYHKTTKSSQSPHTEALIREQLRRMNRLHRAVMTAVGQFGHSELGDIERSASNQCHLPIDATLRRSILAFIDESDLFYWDQIKIDRTDERTIIFLNEKGQYAYFLGCGPAIYSEADWMLKDHKSLLHGYTIKSLAESLERVGMTDITLWSHENAIRKTGKNTYIPDIRYHEPFTGRNACVEVEMGTSKSNETIAKLNKAEFFRTLTLAEGHLTRLEFIADSESTLLLIKRRIAQWQLERSDSMDPDLILASAQSPYDHLHIETYLIHQYRTFLRQRVQSTV